MDKFDLNVLYIHLLSRLIFKLIGLTYTSFREGDSEYEYEIVL